MKKVSKKSKSSGMPMWLIAILVVVTVFLIISLTKSKDSRSSADDSVEAGVVLPVASERK